VVALSNRSMGRADQLAGPLRARYGIDRLAAERRLMRDVRAYFAGCRYPNTCFFSSSFPFLLLLSFPFLRLLCAS